MARVGVQEVEGLFQGMTSGQLMAMVADQSSYYQLLTATSPNIRQVAHTTPVEQAKSS